jgi:hypothetical protein
MPRTPVIALILLILGLEAGKRGMLMHGLVRRFGSPATSVVFTYFADDPRDVALRFPSWIVSLELAEVTYVPDVIALTALVDVLPVQWPTGNLF